MSQLLKVSLLGNFIQSWHCFREPENSVIIYSQNLVLILSVGIGGTYDCTNIVRNPVACGITTLDIDHTAILGKTVEEIAWHKAGIMKNGSIAFADGNIPKVWK